MENFVNQIIAKVRDMYKYTSEYKTILAQPARVLVDEENGTYTVREIIFGKNDVISINDKRVFYEPMYGFTNVMMEYDGMESLLKM